MTEDEYRPAMIKACDDFGRELQALAAVIDDLIETFKDYDFHRRHWRVSNYRASADDMNRDIEKLTK